MDLVCRLVTCSPHERRVLGIVGGVTAAVGVIIIIILALSREDATTTATTPSNR